MPSAFRPAAPSRDEFFFSFFLSFGLGSRMSNSGQGRLRVRDESLDVSWGGGKRLVPAKARHPGAIAEDDAGSRTNLHISSALVEDVSPPPWGPSAPWPSLRTPRGRHSPLPREQ